MPVAFTFILIIMEAIEITSTDIVTVITHSAAAAKKGFMVLKFNSIKMVYSMGCYYFMVRCFITTAICSKISTLQYPITTSAEIVEVITIFIIFIVLPISQAFQCAVFVAPFVISAFSFLPRGNRSN